jgi:hypothetical protein
MISRSIYNLNIDIVYTYDIPIDSSFHQLSNGIRHVMQSADRRLELKAKDIDGSDRLTDVCVLMDLASPVVSQTSVYAKGLNNTSVGLRQRTLFNILYNCYINLCNIYFSSLIMA